MPLFKNPKYYILILLTFVVVFLMGYIGNDEPDKLSRILMNAVAGAVGMAVGLLIYKKRENGDPDDHSPLD
ncbi:hypothetical protein GNY06_06930 [Elizabethkingia argentiflava]|uniref:Uncharacterized protein n=1 Tax=Elizabethkingia argenteiflava TaxID=2681556 RepID=A0A845PXC0_9FLAO|nr:hypothetical protein [Elizabethkingia argenteiflava]NAW51117.1 hypothetical protein [Elizabethkingia argenteiflava]